MSRRDLHAFRKLISCQIQQIKLQHFYNTSFHNDNDIFVLVQPENTEVVLHLRQHNFSVVRTER